MVYSSKLILFVFVKVVLYVKNSRENKSIWLIFLIEYFLNEIYRGFLFVVFYGMVLGIHSYLWFKILNGKF